MGIMRRTPKPLCPTPDTKSSTESNLISTELVAACKKYKLLFIYCGIDDLYQVTYDEREYKISSLQELDVLVKCIQDLKQLERK
jgi:hypothetical protein